MASQFCNPTTEQMEDTSKVLHELTREQYKGLWKSLTELELISDHFHAQLFTLQRSSLTLNNITCDYMQSHLDRSDIFIDCVKLQNERVAEKLEKIWHTEKESAIDNGSVTRNEALEVITKYKHENQKRQDLLTTLKTSDDENEKLKEELKREREKVLSLESTLQSQLNINRKQVDEIATLKEKMQILTQQNKKLETYTKDLEEQISELKVDTSRELTTVHRDIYELREIIKTNPVLAKEEKEKH